MSFRVVDPIFISEVPKSLQDSHPVTTPMQQEEIDSVAKYYYRLHSADISAEDAFERLRQVKRSRHLMRRSEEEQIDLYSQQVARRSMTLTRPLTAT